MAAPESIVGYRIVQAPGPCVKRPATSLPRIARRIGGCLHPMHAPAATAPRPSGPGSACRDSSRLRSRRRCGRRTRPAKADSSTRPPAWARPMPRHSGRCVRRPTGAEADPPPLTLALAHAAARARRRHRPRARPRDRRAEPALDRRRAHRRHVGLRPHAPGATAADRAGHHAGEPDADALARGLARALRASRRGDRRRVARTDVQQARRAGGTRAGAAARRAAGPARLGPVGDAGQPRRRRCAA